MLPLLRFISGIACSTQIFFGGAICGSKFGGNALRNSSLLLKSMCAAQVEIAAAIATKFQVENGKSLIRIRVLNLLQPWKIVRDSVENANHLHK